MDAKAKAIGATEACPVFEVVADGWLCRAGTIVEAFDVGPDGTGQFLDCLHFRVVDRADCAMADPGYQIDCAMLYGMVGFAASATRLNFPRPLTRAARDLLALVTAP